MSMKTNILATLQDSLTLVKMSPQAEKALFVKTIIKRWSSGQN